MMRELQIDGRHIVLDTVTTDGSLVWGCSDCYWTYTLAGPAQNSGTPMDAAKSFTEHSCASFRGKRLAA
jgi:hypothetical protein